MGSFFVRIFKISDQFNPQRIHFLSGLNPAQIDLLLKKATNLKVNSGQTILLFAEPVLGIYIVKSGRVGVYPGNGTQAINYLLPHDCFGEMSFLENLPASATVTAEQDSTELMLITRRKFDEFLKDQPFEAAQIFKQLAVSLSQRLRSANSKLHLELQFIEKIFSELKDNYDDLSGMTNADLSKAKLRTNAFNDNMIIQIQNIKKSLKQDSIGISFIEKITKDIKDFCNLEHIESERHSQTMNGLKVVVKKLDQSLIDLKSTILENQKHDN